MEQDTQQQTFGKYIPHYLRDELMKAREKQQGKEQTEQEYEQAQATTEPVTETQAETPMAAPTKEPQSTEKTETVALHLEEDNDVKAWKGRLKKEQAERQQLNARLIEEAEARERAEKRLKELEQQQQQAEPTHVLDPQGLSEEELAELRLISPELYLKFKEQQNRPIVKQPEIQVQTTTAQPTASTQMQQQAQQSERDRIWYEEIQRAIPEIQGSLGDPDFVAFATGKTDWTGTTGLELIQKAGINRDVLLIPIIRNLLDEYQQSKEQVPPALTVPPQKTAPVKAKVNQPKTMTEQDEAKAEMLARQGKTNELKQFLAQFKKE